MSCSAARWLYSYETQKGKGVLFVEDQWLRKSDLCLDSWFTVEMMSSCSRSSADIIFVSFGSDGAGTWYVRKEVVDYLRIALEL